MSEQATRGNMTEYERIMSDLAQARRHLADGMRDRALREFMQSVERIEQLLARRPQVVLVGEPNAGKTRLANALLGFDLLPESVLANTATRTVLSRAEQLVVHAVDAEGRRPIDLTGLDIFGLCKLERLEVGLPSPRLALHDVVDTPGLREGQVLAVDLGPSDILVWCTVAGQAWKESERRAWSEVPQALRGRALLAVTNTDALKDDAETARVLARMHAETRGLFAEIVATARPAMTAAEETRTPSGIEQLEAAIARLLSLKPAEARPHEADPRARLATLRMARAGMPRERPPALPA